MRRQLVELGGGIAARLFLDGATDDVWVTLSVNNELCRVDLEGGIEQLLVPWPNAGVSGIAVGPDGNVWFTQESASSIGRYTRR